MTDYRLFIAIELPPPVSQALSSLQDRLQAARPVRWIKPAQIHLTLQFLGETPAAKIDPLVAA
jgi:2'-5' RNA ligase